MGNHGFTIIETVIVIVVLGILSATTLPRYIDSSNNARRAVNNNTASALNTSLAGVLARAQVSGAILTGSAATTYSSTTSPVVVNVNNDPNVASNGYIGFHSSSILIPSGAGRAAYSSAPSFGANYADLLKSPPTQGCSNLFNILLGSTSVQTSTITTSTYTTLTTATNAMNTMNGMPASSLYTTTLLPTVPTPLSTSFVFATNAYTVSPAIMSLSATTPPAGSGACVYQMNNTKSTIFYILYDPIKIMFYTGEYTPP
jgi:prepilin-type N-terminal cleavage/methylation domain-containing protein